MTLDHCLPSSILLPRLKNQNGHRLTILFAGLCISILLLTGGNLLSLAGVYTISFLGVMTSFAIGNLILRKNRPDLKRTYKAPFIIVIIGVIATTLGIVGNIIVNTNNLIYFYYIFYLRLL